MADEFHCGWDWGHCMTALFSQERNNNSYMRIMLFHVWVLEHCSSQKQPHLHDYSFQASYDLEVGTKFGNFSQEICTIRETIKLRLALAAKDGMQIVLVFWLWQFYNDPPPFSKEWYLSLYGTLEVLYKQLTNHFSIRGTCKCQK